MALEESRPDKDGGDRGGAQTGRTLGRYRLDKLVGTGLVGEVYLATDLAFDRQVAVKVLQPRWGSHRELRRRFLYEARVLAQFDHPNIIQVVEVGGGKAGQPEETAWYAMAWVPGSKTLREMLDQGFHPSPREAARLVADYAEALAHVHECGYVHKDVRPANVLVDENRRMTLIDLGITRDVAQSSGVPGTVAYVAPEAAATGAWSPAADVYALGVVLYECLVAATLDQAGATSGDPGPASSSGGNTRYEKLSKIREGRHRTPREIDPGIPMDLDAVLTKALSADPRERYLDASTMARDLHSFLDGRVPWAARGTTWSRFRKRVVKQVQRRPWTSMAWSAVVSALLVWAWVELTEPAYLKIRCGQAGLPLALRQNGEVVLRWRSGAEPELVAVPRGRYELVTEDPLWRLDPAGGPWIRASRQRVREIDARPLRLSGWLTLHVEPPTAQALLRDLADPAVELTPPLKGEPRLTAGAWELSVRADGHVGARRTATIAPGAGEHRAVVLADRTIWTHGVGVQTSDGRATPAIAPLFLPNGDILVASGGMADRGLRAFTGTGRLRWSWPAGGEPFPPVLARFAPPSPPDGAPPASAAVSPASPDGILLATTDGTVVRLGLDGAVAWRLSAGALSVPPLAEDLDGDGRREVLLAGQRGTVLCLNANGAERWSFELSSWIDELLVLPPGPDGARELVVAGRGGAFARLGPDGAPRGTWQVPAAACKLRAADLDADGRVELLVGAADGTIRALQAEGPRWTVTVETNALNEPVRPLAADLDADGLPEILAWSPSGLLVCLASDGSERWRHHSGAGLREVFATDLDGDGRPELLLLPETDALACLDAAGTERWNLPLSGPPWAALAVDLDRVGASGPGTSSPGVEILVATAPGALVCVSAAGAQLWTARERGGALAAADLDGDGRLEVLSASWNGKLYALRGELLCEDWTRPLETPPLPLAATRAGPLLVLRGQGDYAAVLDASTGASELLATSQSGPPAWDSAGNRLLLPMDQGIRAWDPDRGTGSVLLANLRPTALATSREHLLVGALADRDGPTGSRLLAFDRAAPDALNWAIPLQGRLEAPPLLLDLDADGRPDHVLAASTAGELLLAKLGGGVTVQRLSLGFPVRAAPLPLSNWVLSGRLPVLLAGQDGVLARFEVSARGLEEKARLDTRRGLAAEPIPLDLDGDDRADRIVLGLEDRWLLAVSADLGAVVWSIQDPEYQPLGQVVAAELDGGGAPEIACAFVYARDPGAPNACEIRIFSAGGALRLRRGARSAPFVLAGPRTAYDLESVEPFVAGAGGQAAAWRPALAPLAADARSAATGRPPAPSNALPPPREAPPEPKEPLELRLEVGAWRDVRGLDLAPRDRLLVRFQVEEARPAAQLLLEHRAAGGLQPGHAAIRILVDGRTLIPLWGAPAWAAEPERFALGALTPGEHTVELQVLAGSATAWSVRRISVD